MKKSNRPTGQKTLFQTWQKQENKSKKQNSESLFETWETSTNTPAVSSSAHHEKPKNLECFEDFITIGDDDDDDDVELLAAVDELEQSENVKNNEAGNLSFTASTIDGGGCDIIPGFDCSAGNSWIYPTNYPLREYQFNIVQKALFHNTLVTLPTGLGKTFIAAVVMYNFYRWYPQGKIIFMAPTKPLVAQQIDACYNIMGIPRQDTAEMTGNKAPTKREELWKQKRVFFLTPQVFQNDLSRGSCRADDVVCLVFDEAHKALGNHSYCQVVREVLGYTVNFRVLALSATPGDGIKAVQQVITNLLVSHIELRSEDSIDIKPYTHQRQVEKIVVKLGDNIELFKTKFLRVLRVVISRLSSHEVLWMRDAERVSKCMLLAAREQFRKKLAAGQQPRRQSGAIEGDFAVAISLYHGYDLLMQHGLLPFYNFLKGIVDGSKGISKARTTLSRNVDFVDILDNLRDQIELPNQSDDSNNGCHINPSFIGHPKLVKLKDIVLEHFRACEDTQAAGNTKGSRVMIFSQFRDSVQEISRMLSEYKPLVKVMSFIGQQSKGSTSKGLTQKEQLEVIRQFRNGGYNTLVATCVGEEGLDIGEVDLIICFDASASPIRLVQRMGRTGRKRDGRIIVLVTEGKEEQVYQRSQRNKSNIHKVILESARTLDLYLENPRMVPKNINPVCQKMFITVAAKSPKNTRKSAKCTRKSADGNIKKLLSANAREGFLSPEELRYWNDNFKLPNHEAGLTPVKSTLVLPRDGQSLDQQSRRGEAALSLTEWTAWQTPLQQVHFVDHSKRSRHFAEILEFCDIRREYNDNDDNYDLEMYSYLNHEDVLRPGETEADACVLGNPGKNKRKEEGREIVVVDVDDDGEVKRTEDDCNNVKEKKDSGETKTGKKDGGKKKKSADRILNPIGPDVVPDDEGEGDGKKTRTKDTSHNTTQSKESSNNRISKKDGNRKRKSTDFGSDTDDDFEDSFIHVSEKTAKTDQSLPRLEPPLGTEPEFSPTKKQLERNSSLTKNRTESGSSLKLSQSRCGNVGSDNDLSDLFDIPSSQRQRNVNRKGQIPNGVKSKGLQSKILPDAPSLDTLLELSAISAGEELDGKSDIEDWKSDQDFFPTMFMEAPNTNKDEACDTSSKAKFDKRKSFDEIGEDECDKQLKKNEIPEKICSSKKSKIMKKNGVWENENKPDTSDIIDKTMFGKTCDQSEKLKRLQERLSLESITEPNSKNEAAYRETNEDSFENNCCGKEKTFEKKFKNKIQDKGLERSAEGGHQASHVFGSGLVCDDVSRIKKDDGVDFDFGQELVNSFFDDDEMDRAKHNDKNKNLLQTPCLFDDDMLENVNERNHTGEQLNRGHKNIDTIKYNLQTPQLFDDEEFESEENDQVMELPNINKHLAYPNLNWEFNCADITKLDCDESVHDQVTASKSQRKPLVEHNVDSETTHELTKLKPQSSLSRIRCFSFFKQTADQSKSLNDVTSKPRDELVNSSHEYGHDVIAPSPLRTSYSGKIDKTKLKHRCSLNGIRSFSFFKQTADQSKSLNDVTAKPRDELVDSSHEYGHDVIAPSPPRASYLGKSDKTRSFRRISLHSKTFRNENERNSETTRNETRKKMLKLKSKDADKDVRSNQTFPVDAEMLKGSSVQNDSLFGGDKMREKETTQMKQTMEEDLSLNQTKFTTDVTFNDSENPDNFSRQTKNDKQPTPLDNSSFTRPSLSPNEQSKVESQPPQNAEYVDTSMSVSFQQELMDEEMDLACLTASNESNSPVLCKEKDFVCLQDIEHDRECAKEEEILNEKPLFKSPPHADRILSGRFKTCGSNKTISGTECRGNFGEESFVDSPLVAKSKGNMRSKAFNKLLDSDEECGDELSDNDGESREERQISNKDGASVVCRKSSSKRNLTRNRSNIVHEIPDSDGEFDPPKKAKRKRESPLLAPSKVNKPKKRRPLVNDFLDVEAEVSEDEINDSHNLSDDEDDIEEMEDSFIDDRSQLTQRSPLTAMKQKKTDKSVNMIDIYRASLLTPHRQQLRFQSPAFHRHKNRYKMVYEKHSSTRNPIASPPDDDSYHNVSMDESNDDTMVEEQDTAGPSSVSSEDSQIVVRKNRRGTRRVLAESYFASPKAADSVDQMNISDHGTKPSDHKTIPSDHKTNRSDHKTKPSNYNTKPSDYNTKPSEYESKPGKPSRYISSRRSLCVEVNDIKSLSSDNSRNSGGATDDAIFKRPVSTAPVNVNRGLCGIAKDSTGYPGDKEDIDDIFSTLNDESLMMMETNSVITTVGKNELNISKKRKDCSSSYMKISTDSRKHERDTKGANAFTNNVKSNEISKLATKPDLSRNVQLNSNDAHVSGTRHSASNSRSSESQQKFGNDSNDLFRNSECYKINTKQCAGIRSTIQSNTSNGKENSRIGLKCQPSYKITKTNANPHLNSTLTNSKNNIFSTSNDNCKTLGSKVKTNESHSSSGAANMVTNVSPRYPPLSTMMSSKDNTNVDLEKTASQVSSLDTSNVTAISVAPSTSSSPALTAAQRDKNKLTILVNSKEVSNCQIVSFLRRKHNIKTIVSPVTGCDYIVSTRMAVERKSVSDISNQSNYRKLVARVRELCDLYDRPCIVIERDRVKNGETQVKYQVRSKYFDRILACLSQARIKVLFSEDQEGTSDILASLAQAEERKDRAIIYPLPLSKEREQIVKFLSSIPRTSYITAISLCYHNKTLRDVINSSAEELVKRAKSLSLKRANDIVNFLQHKFCADMVDCGST